MKLLSPLFFLMIAACAKAPGPVTPITPVERQMVGLLQKFDRWDENGDGHLTAGELRKAEQITGHPPERIVAFYDKSGDRRISLAEAQAGLSRFEEAERAAKR
jgi:hypothetical protein